MLGLKVCVDIDWLRDVGSQSGMEKDPEPARGCEHLLEGKVRMIRDEHYLMRQRNLRVYVFSPPFRV